MRCCGMFQLCSENEHTVLVVGLSGLRVVWGLECREVSGFMVWEFGIYA